MLHFKASKLTMVLSFLASFGITAQANAYTITWSAMPPALPVFDGDLLNENANNCEYGYCYIPTPHTIGGSVANGSGSGYTEPAGDSSNYLLVHSGGEEEIYIEQYFSRVIMQVTITSLE
jgi:hypothetical protein